MSAIAVANKLFGLLQQDTGVNMIDLIGPIEVIAGDALDLVLTVTDDEDAREDLSGLAGDKIRVRIGATLGSASLLELTIGSGITLEDQTSEDTKGMVDVALTSAQTAQTPGLYYLEATVEIDGKRTHVVEPREFTILPALAAVS